MRIHRALLSFVVAAAVWSCADPTSVGDGTDAWDVGPVGPSLAVVSALPAVCGVPTLTRLIADETVPVGTVEVVQDESNFYVVYRTDADWPILKSAVAFGATLAQIPTNKNGNPRVGHFPYRASHGAGTNEVVWEIPRAAISGSDVVIATFAEVGATVEGAWGEGAMITPGGSWAMYFGHTLSDCGAQSVGSAGGSISTPGGLALLQVEPGALTAPVDITIDPTTIEELQAYVDNRSGAEAASRPAGVAGPLDEPAVPANLLGFPQVYDLIPINNTIWNFRPNGLEFATPSKLVLTYEESDLPPNIDESELGVFLINGVIPYLPAPSTVDPVLNTVTADIGHFSFAFIGYRPPADVDLATANLTLSASRSARVGAKADFFVDVTNSGPDAASGGKVTYQVFGDAVLGDLFGSCAEVPTLFGKFAVSCDVAPLAVGARDGIEALQVIPQSVGNIEIWATVSAADGDADGNPANNQLRLTQAVGPAVAVDLEVSDLYLTPSSEAKVGARMDFSSNVTNLGADASSGGKLTYQVYGDAILGNLFGTCVEIPNPLFGDLAVSCEVAPLASGSLDGIESLQIIAQSAGDIEVWASVSPAPGETDTGSQNNQLRLTQTVTPSVVADITVTGATESADPIAAGNSVTYQASIQNLGPDDINDGVVYYSAFGPFVAGTLQPECSEISPPLVADVEITCAVGAIAAGGLAVVAPSATFVAGSPGNFTIWISGSSSATDPDPDNNRYETTITVSAPVADLRVDRVNDTPDPVMAGNAVTWDIDVISMSATAPVTGAVLQLLFTGGNASFASASIPCTVIAGGVGCQLSTLQSGLVENIQIVATLPTAGQTVQAEARVVVPAGIDDPNLTNNSRTQSTTVLAANQGHINFGDILVGPIDGLADTTSFTFVGVPGQFARLALAVTSGSATAQLIIRDPAGTEIFPAPLTRGRATDLSSASHVFPMLSGVYKVQIRPFGTGTYRLGLGTGAGRLDLSWGPSGQGVALGPRSSSPGNPFWGMELVGAGLVTIGESALSRFDSNGLADASFGSGGAVDLTAALGVSRWGQAMRVQPDGRIVVAARSTALPYPWIVARFNANGSLDPSFGTGGLVQVALGNQSYSRPLGVRFQQNGSDLDIIIAGNGGGRLEQVGIARLNPNGSLDTGFGTNGIVFENGGFAPSGMDIQSDGSILVTANRQIRRYTPNGVRDAGFGVGGLVTYGITGNARGMLVLPDDRLLVVGDQSGDALIMRLTSDGVLDGSFAGGGIALYDFGLADRFQAATLDGAGQMVVIGHQRTLGGDYEFLVTRMSMGGVLDGGFGVAGYLTEFQVDDARAVVIDGAGRILVGGQEMGSLHQIEITRHTSN